MTGDTSAAELSLREGRPADALRQLQDRIRQDPSDPKLRVFLFQLLAVLGQWSRADTQLGVLTDLDPSAMAMVHTYRPALRCEALRAAVFAGRTAPTIFGKPEAWVAPLVEALRLDGAGRHDDAAALRDRALEEAEPTAGTTDGAAFAWIADADSRIGPMLEVVLNGQYYWVPFARIREIELEAPADLRDRVWAPGRFVWANGGKAVGLIPVRYPGSDAEAEGAVQMAARTEWRELAPDSYAGLGQRLLATDAGEHPILDIRRIALDVGEAAEPAAADG